MEFMKKFISKYGLIVLTLFLAVAGYLYVVAVGGEYTVRAQMAYVSDGEKGAEALDPTRQSKAWVDADGQQRAIASEGREELAKSVGRDPWRDDGHRLHGSNACRIFFQDNGLDRRS